MLKFLGYTLLLIICLFFGFSNSSEVNLVVIPGNLEVNTRLYLVIFLFFLIGYFSCYLLYSYKLIRLKLSCHSQKKQIIRLEKTIKSSEKKASDSIEIVPYE